jgi:hypothetical protein
MAENQPAQSLPKEELIGFHKGSLNTLIAERNELLRIIKITEQLIQAHAKELESLGVNLHMQAEQPETENTK